MDVIKNYSISSKSVQPINFLIKSYFPSKPKKLGFYYFKWTRIQLRYMIKHK